MKKKIEKIYFVHRGAHFCEISIFAQSEITRPFHKIKAWNKKEKIFFYHFKHKKLKKTWNFFFGAKFFFFGQNLKNVYGRLFFLGWLRCPIPVAIEFYSQKEKVSSCKRPIFWLEHIFFKKCPKTFFLEGRGGVKKIIFYPFLNGVTNILP